MKTRIKELRLEKKLTQKVLAEYLGRSEERRVGKECP